MWESLSHGKLFPLTCSILHTEALRDTSQPLGLLALFPAGWCDIPDSPPGECAYNACLPTLCIYKSPFTWRTGTPHLCCQMSVSCEEPAKHIIALPNACQPSRKVTPLVGNVSSFSSWSSPGLKCPCLNCQTDRCHQKQLAKEITPWKNQVIWHFCKTFHKSALKPAFYF